MEKILVVEDIASLREVLSTVLTCEGFLVSTAETAEEAISKMAKEDFALILSDLKLPGMNGLDLIRESKAINSSVPVLVMTAYGSIDIAVEAMKLGAVDFVTKPFDPSVLCNLISQIAEHRRIVDRSPNSNSKRERKFITQSPLVEQVLYQAQKVAPISSSVLILGESGTGKELVARYIHEQSPRKSAPFVGVNCGSMPSELLESEFFGHEAGAFTGATEQRLGLFEVAKGGTIFLDEIGNMPNMLQMKLLRTLQESEIKRLGSTKTLKIDARVISATNCQIQEEISSGRFREDLFYRLGVVILEIPPLRKRREDIPLLANYFLKSFAAEFERESATISPAGMRKLESYSWPGNVRELENTIQRAMIFNEGVLDTNDFEFSSDESSTSDVVRRLPEVTADAVRKAEMEAISRVLAEFRGNKSKAAKALGISYKTLLNKVKDYALGE